MAWLWEHVMMAGWVAWLILLLAVVGLGAATGTLIATAVGSKHAREAGWACLGIAALCAGLGLGGMQLGRATVDDVVDSGAISPLQRERIRRQGYLETRSAVVLGLIGCAVPLLAGSVGTAVGSLRRRKRSTTPAAAVPAALPPPGAPPAVASGGRDLGWLVTVGLALILLLGVAGSAAALVAPLPSPDMADLDDR